MQVTNMTDDELIHACRNGNAQAWEQILLKYERLVYSIPLHLSLGHSDAADITQLTFTALLESLNNFYPNTSLGAWLPTVARRYAWRVIKHQRRETIIDSDSDMEGVSENASALGMAPSGDRIAAWELAEWLNQGLSQLGERCRELLLALYFDPDEPKHAQVAERLDIPLGGIGPTRKRCLEQLRLILSKST